MKEQTGNTEAVRSLKHFDFLAYKISDQRGHQFTETKPCDILACSPEGIYIAIEGKIMKRWTCFNEKVLRPNQIAQLNGACLKRGGRAFVFLYVRIKADRQKGIKRCCKLVVFDWNEHWWQLKGKGYGVAEMRAQSVGVWLDPSQVEGKIIWPLKDLLNY